jgi:hypothetical protein
MTQRLVAIGMDEQGVDSYIEEFSKKDRCKVTQLKRDILLEETF